MSKIRFFKISTFYLKYLELFYAKNITPKEITYDEHFKLLVSDCYGWADFWKINLERTGQYEVFESFMNADILQRQWAKENGFKNFDEELLSEILLQQIVFFKPQVLFCEIHIDPSFILKVKKECPGIELIVGWDGIAMYSPGKFKNYDMVLSCSEDITEYYSSHGFKTYFFEFGFEKSILNKLVRTKEQYDFSFVGSLSLGKGLHNARFSSIAELARNTPLSIFTPYFDRNWQLYKYPQRLRLLQGRFKEFLDTYSIGRKVKGEAFGLEMYNILFNSKIVFNSHIDASLNKAGNMRLFEATGVGACLVTDSKSNIHELFEPDKEVVVYKSIEECIDKVKWLLENDSKREEIANAGQKRTLESYTLEKRILKFSDFLEKFL